MKFGRAEITSCCVNEVKKYHVISDAFAKYIHVHVSRLYLVQSMQNGDQESDIGGVSAVEFPDSFDQFRRGWG